MKFSMAFPSSVNFLSFFFLSHLLVIFHLVDGQNRNQATCPKEFKCGKLGNMSFPFTERHKPGCGLCSVDCQESNQQINIWVGEDSPSSWPNIMNLSPNHIQIEVKNSCYVFQNLEFLRNKDAPFHITSKLTSLVKCPFGREGPKFHPNLEKFSDCEEKHEFTIYYVYNSTDKTISNYSGPPPPPPCSTIQLPLEHRSYHQDISGTVNILHILAENISLEWDNKKTWPCYKCFDDDHQCIVDQKNYTDIRCSNEGKNKKLGLIFGSGTSKKWGLILGSVGGIVSILVICGIVFVIWCQKKRNKDGRYLAHCWETKPNDYKNIENFLKNYGSGSAPKRFKYHEIKRITNSYKNKLGQGGFGSVFKGYLDDKIPVAVKLLSTSKGTGEEFINEVASISNTSHVNVVKLLGFCFEYNKRALVYEYMPKGSLEKFIFVGKSKVDFPLGWPALFKIAVGIARGLEYLHLFCATRMVHFDIKPHNVLLDEEYCPKISDFGLAKLCGENKSMVSLSGARGTIGYIAPEVVFRNFGGVSHKSDVYSYGMMILEMVGGRKNSDMECNESSQMYFPHWIYSQLERDQEIVLPSITKTTEKESARKMIIVSLWCIQTDPSHRPTMSRVVEMLEGELDMLQIPPRPYLFSSANSCIADSSSLH